MVTYGLNALVSVINIKKIVLKIVYFIYQRVKHYFFQDIIKNLKKYSACAFSFKKMLLFFLGLIGCLIPYVYFSFQVGPLCFKNFELVPYVLKVLSWSKTLLTLE